MRLRPVTRRIAQAVLDGGPITRVPSGPAAWGLADDVPGRPVAVALATAYCWKVAVHAAQECVQLPGGIGFTWEHPVHLYLTRPRRTGSRPRTHTARRPGVPGRPPLP